MNTGAKLSGHKFQLYQENKKNPTRVIFAGMLNEAIFIIAFQFKR